MRLPADIKKIAIFRALQLGDMLCIIPAMRGLRSCYQEAEIILIGLPWAQSYTARFNAYFNGFIPFPGYPGLPEQPVRPLAVTEFLSFVQKEKFDLVIQMQGNGSVVNPLVELMGTRYYAGYKVEGHYAPANGLFMPYPDYGHEIERHLLLMEFLGIQPQGHELEFHLNKPDLDALSELKLDITPGYYVCIHPGSRGSWRQWPAENFATLADFCARQGLSVVVTGTPDEMPVVNKVIGLMHHKAINAAGKTSIGAVGALIKNARMLISNCTGVSHIAAAVKTKSIVISMDGEPTRWAPLDKSLHHTFDWTTSQDFEEALSATAQLLNGI